MVWFFAVAILQESDYYTSVCIIWPIPWRVIFSDVFNIKSWYSNYDKQNSWSKVTQNQGKLLKPHCRIMHKITFSPLLKWKLCHPTHVLSQYTQDNLESCVSFSYRRKVTPETETQIFSQKIIINFHNPGFEFERKLCHSQVLIDQTEASPTS